MRESIVYNLKLWVIWNKEEFIKLNINIFESVEKFYKKFEIKIREKVVPVKKTGKILPQMIKERLKDTLIVKK